MIFYIGRRIYFGKTAANIVRAMMHESQAYAQNGGTVYEFLRWSLTQLSDRVPLRELDLSAQLSEETLALGYLCLLDQYGLGKLHPLPDYADASVV